MKTKLFLAAMAAVAVIGCQKEPAGSVQVADGTASFLSVNLNAAGAMTKAAEDTFEYGLATENAVNSVTFYFFKENGDPYVVQGVENWMSGQLDPDDWNTKPGGNQTQKPEELAPTLEKVSGMVLVIKQHQDPNDLPAKMVAILNGDPTVFNTSMSLSDLEDVVLNSLTYGDYFTMSNSVYAGTENSQSVKINTTPITAANLFNANIEPGQVGYNPPGTILTPGEEGVPATGVTPVEIYVERVAVKVRVHGATGVDLTKVPVMSADGEGATQLKDAAGNAVYMKVLGWDVTNNTDETYLLKDINPSWTDLGFTPWNNPAFFRSYWAKTTDEPLHNITFTALKGGKNLDPGYAYYFENTAAAAENNGVDVNNNGEYNEDGLISGTKNQAPQLLVAAQLVDVNGKAIDIAKWYGKLYTINGVKDAMVGTIDHRIFKVTDDTGESIEVAPITSDDVVFEQAAQGTAAKRYNVYVKVDSKKAAGYYVNETGQPYTHEEVQDILDTVDPAQMFKDGYTYYYTTIKHFGATGKPAEFGLVRNHCYDIAIENVVGFGTPVWNEGHVITPEKPTDETAVNLSARINILAWHIVSQDVTLGM